MRDWYALGQLTLLPMAATLVLHLLLLAFLVLRWQPASDPRTIEARVLPPSVIKATLIDAASLKPKPKPKAPKVRTQPSARQRGHRAASPRRAARRPDSRPLPQQPRSRPRETGPAKAAPAKARAADQRRGTGGDQPSGTRCGAAAEEETLEVAVTAEQMSASYAALIRDTVVNYWSRPPSARNGMEALLAIQLVPTGEIVSVSVLRSSGSTAFRPLGDECGGEGRQLSGA
jgi:outer membrane biosynthesis protein TonB